MEANAKHTSKACSVPVYPWIYLPAPASGWSAFGETLERAKHAAHAKRAQRARATPAAAPAAVPLEGALEGPPPDLRLEMDAAARVCQTLAAQGKELRFGTTADGRVTVELTDAAGHALDAIGPSGLFRLLQQAT